jgi:hypothetical protein
MRHVRGERWRKAARPGVWVEIAVQQSRSAPAGSDFDARGGGMVLCQPNANVSGVVAGPPTCLAALPIAAVLVETWRPRRGELVPVCSMQSLNV